MRAGATGCAGGLTGDECLAEGGSVGETLYREGCVNASRCRRVSIAAIWLGAVFVELSATEPVAGQETPAQIPDAFECTVAHSYDIESSGAFEEARGASPTGSRFVVDRDDGRMVGRPNNTSGMDVGEIQVLNRGSHSNDFHVLSVMASTAEVLRIRTWQPNHGEGDQATSYPLHFVDFLGVYTGVCTAFGAPERARPTR